MLRPVAFAAAALALAGLVLNWPAAEPAQGPAPQTAPLRESALAERMARLERELERLSAQVDALASAAEPAQRTADARPIATPPREEAPRGDVAALSQDLERQDADDSWQNEITDYLTGELRDPRWSQSNLLEVDCRTTLCRVQLEHEGTEQANAFTADLALAQLDVGSYTVEQDTSGERPVWTLVLLRRGAGQPSF
jgi:hypothetical protein